MIREAFGTKQINRLMRLPFAPGEKEDAAALKDEFRRQLRACSSENHLEAVVDHLMDTCARVPAPAEVRDACATVTAPEKAKAPMGCGKCQGSGWYSYTKVVTNCCGTYPADFADFCTCERGQWMRTMERQRKEEAASRKGR